MSDFRVIESLFSELLSSAGEVLSEEERAEIKNFIEVGEYGLALETTVDIYAEENKLATAAVKELIGRLAKSMSLDAAPMLRRLGS